MCTDIKRALLPEEGGNVENLEGADPPSNSNATDKKMQRREGLNKQYKHHSILPIRIKTKIQRNYQGGHI